MVKFGTYICVADGLFQQGEVALCGTCPSPALSSGVKLLLDLRSARLLAYLCVSVLQLWDREGKPIKTLASLPLAEDIPIAFNSCRTGAAHGAPSMFVVTSSHTLGIMDQRPVAACRSSQCHTRCWVSRRQLMMLGLTAACWVSSKQHCTLQAMQWVGMVIVVQSILGTTRCVAQDNSLLTVSVTCLCIMVVLCRPPWSGLA
jgi:hypothetical protein